MIGGKCWHKCSIWKVSCVFLFNIVWHSCETETCWFMVMVWWSTQHSTVTAHQCFVGIMSSPHPVQLNQIYMIYWKCHLGKRIASCVVKMQKKGMFRWYLMENTILVSGKRPIWHHKTTLGYHDPHGLTKCSYKIKTKNAMTPSAHCSTDMSFVQCQIFYLPLRICWQDQWLITNITI